ncbi:hypothetical protein AAP_03163 [Ascosphaera apis ARSEF 7405]|uniref:Uncharacterized protein n=1 Tax=Ascosphaera apis ARSEF 7405 TaxID=392613 RepID=A0A167YZ41_9EURO|nr:hypothetical protein AAP_03163 [Ascosphaera apis ARSEF 7405]
MPLAGFNTHELPKLPAALTYGQPSDLYYGSGAISRPRSLWIPINIVAKDFASHLTSNPLHPMDIESVTKTE